MLDMLAHIKTISQLSAAAVTLGWGTRIVFAAELINPQFFLITGTLMPFLIVFALLLLRYEEVFICSWHLVYFWRHIS